MSQPQQVYSYAKQRFYYMVAYYLATKPFSDTIVYMNEIIYVLTNDALPGYVKIGRTSTSLEQRIKELSSSTSIPLPFTCFYACTVKDANFVEAKLHDAFADNRINPKREFFQISPERVRSALKIGEIEDITPKKDFIDDKEDQKAVDKVRSEIRERFNFDMVNIPVGSELVFSRDENIKATVADNRHISFNGEITSLSTSAQKILGYDYGVQGTAYWKYGEETLDELRRKFEN